MPTIAQIQALAEANKTTIESIQGSTIDVSALTSAQKRILIENIFPNGVAINVNDPNLKVGDHVFGEKAGINDGNWFFGVVISLPVSSDSNVQFKYAS